MAETIGSNRPNVRDRGRSAGLRRGVATGMTVLALAGCVPMQATPEATPKPTATAEPEQADKVRTGVVLQSLKSNDGRSFVDVAGCLDPDDDPDKGPRPATLHELRTLPLFKFLAGVVVRGGGKLPLDCGDRYPVDEGQALNWTPGTILLREPEGLLLLEYPGAKEPRVTPTE